MNTENAISTFETGQTFEDAMTMHLEELLHADVQYGRDFPCDYTISDADGESFRVQVVLTAEIPNDTLVGGLRYIEGDAPTVTVDDVEYTIVRQW